MRIASRSVFVIVSLHPPNGDQSARTRKLLIPPRWPSVLYPADLRLGSSSKQTYASACPLWIAENKARGLLLDGPKRRSHGGGWDLCDAYHRPLTSIERTLAAYFCSLPWGSSW